MRLITTFAILIILLGTAAFAAAQETYVNYGQRNEIGGIIGRVFISNEGVNGTDLTDSNIHFGSTRQK